MSMNENVLRLLSKNKHQKFANELLLFVSQTNYASRNTFSFSNNKSSV
jgi:hypothetical protein